MRRTHGMDNYEKQNADVLVVGGAITGMVAAIRAKEFLPEGKVLVIEKGKASRSGCSNWAGGDITFVLPEDDVPALIEKYKGLGDGVADPEWIEFALTETYARVMDMVRFGVPFERDSVGTVIRKGGRGGGALCAISRGSDILKTIRKTAEKMGVTFVDKVMVTDLLRDEHGAAAGVVGFKVGTEEVQPVVFTGKAVILVTGPVSFKASYIGHRMCTGEGLAIAFRHGAEFMGMEFASGHNTGPRHFDMSGMARFVAMGGKFLNAKGEEFMSRYDPVLKNMAGFGTLNFGMAMEVREGRGPIYFDLTALGPEDLNLQKKIIPHTFLALERMNLDTRRDRIEWIPCYNGNRASGAGIRIRKDMSTTVPGLFTGGDCGGKFHYGANAGYHGMNFGWCAISGYHAAQSAIAWGRENPPGTPSGKKIKETLEDLLLPSRVKGGVSPDDATAMIQKNLIPYDIIILKHKERLRAAISNLEGLETERIRAQDTHDLMKAHEAKSMAINALMILKASLLREETRGTHHREDFPKRDDSTWGQWLYLKKKGERMDFWTEPKDGSKTRVGEL
jgi:succinate dehydrogenase / fumarate reductase flavoprotein subunit